jgi:hypothetical protein
MTHRGVDPEGVWEEGTVSLAPAELDRLRADTIADLATLRQVPDLVALLRPSPMANGEPLPTVWWLTADSDDSNRPLLVLGIRGDVGFLHWYDDPGINQVPLGTEYRDGPTHDYFRSGVDHAAVVGPGEELAAANVYEAAIQFVATGKRPASVQWMNEADVPDHRPPPSPPEDSAIYRAMKAAVAANGTST